MSKLLKTFSAIGSAIASGFRAIGRGFQAVGKWCQEHWAFTAAIILALIAFAAVTAALIFFWPATIGALAAITLALPAIGTFAPFAFLATLSIPAAAAVVGAFAFVGVLAVSGLINLFAAAYNGLDRWLSPKTGRGGRAHDESSANDEDTTNSERLLGQLSGDEEEEEELEEGEDFTSAPPQRDDREPAHHGRPFAGVDFARELGRRVPVPQDDAAAGIAAGGPGL